MQSFHKLIHSAGTGLASQKNQPYIGYMVKESFFVTSNNLSKINVAAKSAFHYTSENFEVNSR